MAADPIDRVMVVPPAVTPPLPGEPSPGSPGRGTQTSPQPSERQAAGRPDPGTGREDPAAGDRMPSRPGRGTDTSPAGGALEGARSVPAGTTGRTYTIALPPGIKLLSLNDRLHYGERYSRAQVIKEAAWALALHYRVPPLARARIAVEYQPPDRRHRDADNPVASAKAAVDGIVLAGVLEDDECPRYVTGIWCTIGEYYPKGRLVLTITEVAP